MQTLAWGLTFFLALPVQADSGTTRVAVVNIPEVSDKYQRTTDLEAQFDGVRGKYNQDREAMKDRLDRMAKSLREELKPGTEEYRERAKQVTMLEAEFKWFSEAEGQRIEEGLKSTLRSIFDDIQTAVQEVAVEKGIDIVMVGDRLPDQIPDSPSQLRQQIVLQKVVYWNPRVDITADVVNRLNSRYQAQAPAVPAANPAPGSARPKEKPDVKKPGKNE